MLDSSEYLLPSIYWHFPSSITTCRHTYHPKVVVAGPNSFVVLNFDLYGWNYKTSEILTAATSASIENQYLVYKGYAPPVNGQLPFVFNKTDSN